MSHRLIEALENRTLLAANAIAFLTPSGFLYVKGYDAATNQIDVAYSADGTKVDVSLVANTLRGTTKTFSTSFDAADVKKVRIRGGALADTINVGQVNQAFDIITRVDGRKGNDTITTGDERDVINGGWGNDTVTSGGGDDLVWGSRGNDVLSGGDGNDTIWGGLGDDTIMGGSGDDKLGGFLGANELLGEEGKDTFIVRSLSANPVNDYNAAEDVLRALPPSGTESPEPTPI